MRAINQHTSMQELAAVVSETLEGAGIRATLSGGGAVSLYSQNQYVSYDLDFVTSERNAVIAKVLAPLGFRYEVGTREFTHADTDLFVEFPAGPLAFGETRFSDDDATVLQTEFGPVRIITATHCVMDRLAAYSAWRDNQAFDQAVMVARRHLLDWEALAAWAVREGIDDATLERLRSAALTT